MIRKFALGADKIVGYKRLVGHEVCREGFSGPKLCAANDSHNDGSKQFTTLLGGVPTIPQHSVTPVSSTSMSLLSVLLMLVPVTL